MWNKDFNQTEGRLLLLIGQFIALLMCIGYINYIYVANISPDTEAKAVYQKTECFLISKKLSTKGHLIHSYRADFLISYNVKGVQYNRWVSGNGLDMAYTRNSSEQEDLLASYRSGGTYPCWYNPDDPQIAILVQRHSWLSTFPLMVSSAIGVIVIYYFLKNLFHIISTSKAKKHRKK